MPGGRGIHDDEVKSVSLGPAGDFQQRHEFIQAGEGEVQDSANIIFIQEGAPGRNLGKLVPVPDLKGLQGILGVELQNLQISGGLELTEAVGQGMGRISRNQEKVAVGGSEGLIQRGSGSTGGLAHAALAAEE